MSIQDKKISKRLASMQRFLMNLKTARLPFPPTLKILEIGDKLVLEIIT